MARPQKTNVLRVTPGDQLEARMLRISLAQGIFAERSLFPAATSDHRMIATDIDVLATEYHSDFHATKRSYECKSGARISVLDRILWVAGVKCLIDADASYLVTPKCTEEIVQFGRRVGVQVMGVDEIDRLEKALKVEPEVWPGRSNISLFESAKSAWRGCWGEESPSDPWTLLKSAFAFVEVDSWLEFNYRSLNRVLRYMEQVGNLLSRKELQVDQKACAHYVLGALAVRFSQYLLHTCKDVAGYEMSYIPQYLTTRLTFGDHSETYVSGLIRGTVELMTKAIAAKVANFEMPHDIGRLSDPPKFANDFAKLIAEVRTSPTEAPFLPLSVEMHFFGGSETGLDAIHHASQRAERLTGLLIGFLIRSLAIPNDVMRSCIGTLEDQYRVA